MNNLQKVRKTFVQHGYQPNTWIRRFQFQNLLNSLITGDLYTPEVAAQIWQQASQNREEAQVEWLCKTIFDAQNIVQMKLFDLSDQIKIMEQNLQRGGGSGPSGARSSELMRQLQEKEEQKKSFEEDLAILTEPFGISMIAFMANAAKSRHKVGQPQGTKDYQILASNSEQIQLKWLFYLCIIFGLIELIVIYQKYDFLNLMVFASLMLIFFMNQLDSTYMKFTLILLGVSQLLDVIWLFMNGNHYWNLPSVGTITLAMGGYMKFIVFLTFIGVFIKIPLGVFLFHYKNIDTSKKYMLDMGFFKMQLTPNRQNPITQALKNLQILPA